MAKDDDQNSADLVRGETGLDGEILQGARSDPDPGTTVAGRYAVFGRVGEGGMGTVYRVEDLELHELVALKLLDADAAEDEEAVDQFRREVRLARRVAHRNVVRTYDYGTANGRPFLTMEFVDGIDLREALETTGLTRSEAISTGESIAAGLAEAHRVGIIHRDLKPGNVLLGNRGRVAVSDFGIAGALRGDDPTKTLNQKGAGTPAYMAPEQLRGRRDMDHRVDVYAFGVLMFELLTGELPWSRNSALATAVARLDEPPPSLRERANTVSDTLAVLVDSCLRRDRDERPEGFDAIERDLEQLQGNEPARVRAGGRTETAALAVEETRPAHEGVTTVGSTERDVVRIAVAYWETNGDLDGEIADGIRETIMYRLSYFDDLDLRMREVGEAEERHEVDPGELARRVDADVVVAGEVETDGEDSVYWAECRLFEVFPERLRWWSREEIRRERVRQIAAQWAEQVADELGAEESSEPGTALEGPAHTMLMEGRHQMRKRWYDDIGPALKRLEAARDRAPEHPRTLSQLAVARARQAYLDDAGREEHVERAIELAREAIDRAGDAWAEPRYALAMAHFNNSNFGQAVATLRAALVRDPEFAEAHELLGRILLEIGPLEHGLQHLERAVDINPFLYRGLWDLMRGRGLSGDWEAVGEIADTEVDSEYQRYAAATVALRMLLWREHPALQRLVDREREILSQKPLLSLLEFVEGGSYRDELADDLYDLVDAIPEGSRRRPLICQVAAEAAAVAGRPPRALEFIGRAITEGLTDVVWLQHCPVFDSLRDRNEFQMRVEQLQRQTEEIATRR